MKVRLIDDYTKYNEKLDKGIIGNALETPEEQQARKPEDNFVRVEFEGITTVDVLWRGLEIIDDVYLSEKQRLKDEYFSKMVTAQNVILTLGPKGGFKHLKLSYIDNSEEIELFIENKEEAEEYLVAFEKYNISYETVMLEGKRAGRKSKEVNEII